MRGEVRIVPRTRNPADLSAPGGLTPRLRKRAISGWKPPRIPPRGIVGGFKDVDYHQSKVTMEPGFSFEQLKRYGQIQMNAGMSEQAVSRVLFPEEVAHLRDNDHSSSLDVTVEVKRPTRELGRTALRRPPIWSCSWWGLPSSHRHRQDW